MTELLSAAEWILELRGSRVCLKMRTLMPGTFTEVFGAFLRLGLTCFGGPVAHLGFFHEDFVVRRRWLEEADYADLVALCQFLPGPASSQVGMAIGLRRAGWKGMLAAWLGFTLPSTALMITFAYGVDTLGDLRHAGWLKGLKLAAAAVVAQAIWTMATKLCPDRARRTLAFAAACVVLIWPASFVQIIVIAAGALVGRSYFKAEPLEGLVVKPPAHTGEPAAKVGQPLNRRLGSVSLVAFGALLFILPVLAGAMPGIPAGRLVSSFYRVGSLVFGGGHVVLPLLQAEAVEHGWLSNDRFLAGYGAAQALPGPLFAFAGYLGVALRPPFAGGWPSGVLAIVAIFLPSMLLIMGVLPYWNTVRRWRGAQEALQGANAVVVGVLLAALYDPVWTSTVHSSREFVVVLGAFGLLMWWRCPPWLVVLLTTAVASLIFR